MTMRGVVTCARLEIVFRALLDAGERGITLALIHRRDLKDVCHLTFQDPMSQESGQLQMIHNTLSRERQFSFAHYQTRTSEEVKTILSREQEAEELTRQVRLREEEEVE